MIRWNDFRWVRMLLTLAVVFVCSCTLLMSGTGEAKGKIHRLMSIESHALEIDGRDAVRIRIGMNRRDLSYAIMANEQSELRIVLEDVKLDKKLPSEYVPQGTLADKVTIMPEGKDDAILTIEAKDSFLHKDAFRIRTMPGTRTTR